MSEDRLSAPALMAVKRFCRDKLALAGMAGILLIFLPALYAPFIANGRPLCIIGGSGVTFPFLRFFFAPESSESMVEKLFNFLSLYLPMFICFYLLFRKKKILRYTLNIFTALLLFCGFIFSSSVMDKKDYRMVDYGTDTVIFAPIPYGPDEIAGVPYGEPDKKHILGCDDVGRDLAARMIYGARVSLSVGLLSATLALVIGLAVGLCAGFFKGKFDLIVMRTVEILLCFPSFLLLLILMSMLGDYKIAQSIPLVIGVLGLTGWMNLAFLVRGEVLKESSLPYVQSCIVSGISGWKIMFRHLLPNIAAPVLISFTFGVAGAIAGESGLSFLGFGVQPPTASWGNLLRQAFDNPLGYWHLTFYPGAVLFISVLAFNFTGEGLRRAFDVKEV